VQPSRVEPVSRRTSRIITSTIRVPTTAAETRQPNEFIPKKCSPAAMTHLPTSGCTTMLGVSVNRPSTSPRRMRGLALST